MIGFIQDKIKNPTRALEEVPKAAGQATVMRELLAWDVLLGLAVPATATTVRSEVIGVSNSDILVTDALTRVLVIDIFDNDTWVVDCTNNSDAAMDGQRMILTDSTHVNNTGVDTASGIVIQVEPFGLPADKKIVVKFV